MATPSPLSFGWTEGPPKPRSHESPPDAGSSARGPHWEKSSSSPALDLAWTKRGRESDPLIREPLPSYAKKPQRIDPSLFNSSPFALDVLGGIPISAMPGEGHRRWGTTPVDLETKAATEEILLEGRPGAAAQLSLFRAFERWRSVNPLLPTAYGEVLAIFGGYLYEHDLKCSTCVTYVRTALFFLRRSPPNAEDPKWYLASDVIRGLDRLASRETRDHAIDIDEDRALHILRSMVQPDLAFTIWLMLVCGARCSDLARLAPSQIVLTANKIFIHFRETKTVARPINQYSVELPLWIPFKEEWRIFLTSRETLPADCDRLNKSLHAAGFPETTYSFRRLFINRVIHKFTEDGVTDWLRVIELTGHRKSNTVKGLYKQHLLDFSWSQ